MNVQEVYNKLMAGGYEDQSAEDRSAMYLLHLQMRSITSQVEVIKALPTYDHSKADAQIAEFVKTYNVLQEQYNVIAKRRRRYDSIAEELRQDLASCFPDEIIGMKIVNACQNVMNDIESDHDCGHPNGMKELINTIDRFEHIFDKE